MCCVDSPLYAGGERNRMLMIAAFQMILILMFGLGTWAFAYLLQRNWRTGSCRLKGHDYTREDHPLLYWANIVMLIVWVVLLPCCFVYGEYMLIQMVRMGTFPP